MTTAIPVPRSRRTGKGLERASLAVMLVALAVGASPTMPVSASVEHDECVRRLLEAPLEEAALPEGWQWESVQLGEYYFRSSPSPASLWAQLGGTAELGSDFSVWLWLTCVPNADVVLERMVDSWLAADADAHDVGPVGDQSVALSYDDLPDPALPEGTYTFWRSGDVVGRIRGGNIGLSEQGEPARALEDDLVIHEAIARSVSDVLADAGLAGPVTADDACVRRLVAAPIEEVLGPYGPVLHVFETITPAWIDEGFALSCQPEAGLFMERWVRVERLFGKREYGVRSVVREVEPIGDDSLALCSVETDANDSDCGSLLWHSGDVLAEFSSDGGAFQESVDLGLRMSDVLATDGPVPKMSLTPETRACARRLLEAPIEDVNLWRGKRRGDPWYGLSLGYDRAYATWVGHPRFELGCQANADLIMDRAAGLIDGKIREIDDIGDRAIAIGPKRQPTLLWRDGDVLGQAYGDDLEGLTRFARKVNARLD